MPESIISLLETLLDRYGPGIFRLGIIFAGSFFDDPAMLALAFC